jgi:hypothetical protein
MLARNQLIIVLAICCFSALGEECTIASYREYRDRWNKPEATSVAEFNVKMAKYCENVKKNEEINSQ